MTSVQDSHIYKRYRLIIFFVTDAIKINNIDSILWKSIYYSILKMDKTKKGNIKVEMSKNLVKYVFLIGAFCFISKYFIVMTYWKYAILIIGIKNWAMENIL